jgi:hypothetical protein
MAIKDPADLHRAFGPDFGNQIRRGMDAAKPIGDVVIPAPVPRRDIRVWRETKRVFGPFDQNDLLDRARRVPLTELVQRLGYDLKRRGSEWAIVCPFHEDRNPSLRINASKGTWFCDPCGEGGDVIEFVMKLRGLSFPDALKVVAS